MLNKNRVVVGMSGGVDSSVAAHQLKEAGYEVIGIFMKLWDDGSPDYVEKEGGCCSLSAAEDARRVAASLDIPFYVINFREIFQDTVIDYFVHEYELGRTPNPCIACNKHVKFDALLNKAHQLGAYYVATGHYAKIEKNPETDRYIMKMSNEAKKDQTYMLYNLTQFQLEHMLTPLGDFSSKEEVRKIAEQLDLDVSVKRDSQEICFIPDDDYAKFVTENTDKEMGPGKFVDTEGNILGDHKGIIYYTVGQRKGLGITFGKPMYVVEIRPQTNEVVLGSNKEVFSQGLIADQVNFIPFDDLEGPIQAQGKVRYSSRTSPCTIKKVGDDQVEVIFDDMQRAVTPGQAVVFYQDDLLIGGGTILNAIQ